MLFGPRFFNKYQKILLFCVNELSDVGRWFFAIHGDRSSVGKHKITEIGRNFIEWKNPDNTYSREYRTHNKYSKRLLYGLYPVWFLIHIWDTVIANNIRPSWNLGFDTLTAYPDAHTESTSVDGQTHRTVASESFATIRAGAGTTVDDSSAGGEFSLYASTTTNEFTALYRFHCLFDTSSLTSSADITAAVLSLYGIITAANGLGGTPSANIVSSAPASNTALATGDHANMGTTDFGSILWSSLAINQYNDFTLNADGRANISKTGISKFGARTSFDRLNSFDGTWSSEASCVLVVRTADQTGTDNDPKLVITYGAKSPSASQSPSASLSPSSSVSASLSPSASVSPSSSISPSASISPSSSSSASRSPSSSISLSVSPSPSAGYSLYSRGDVAALPGNTDDLETLYNGTDETNVDTRNNVYVGQTGTLQYMIHQFKNFVGSQTTGQLEWEGKTALAPSSSTVYLQIYNRNTNAWETVDSDNSSSADVDFELTAVIADFTNYKDASNVIVCRVYQLAT